MKSRDAMNTRFYVENPHTNCGDKKTTRSKTININPRDSQMNPSNKRSGKVWLIRLSSR